MRSSAWVQAFSVCAIVKLLAHVNKQASALTFNSSNKKCFKINKRQCKFFFFQWFLSKRCQVVKIKLNCSSWREIIPLGKCLSSNRIFIKIMQRFPDNNLIRSLWKQKGFSRFSWKISNVKAMFIFEKVCTHANLSDLCLMQALCKLDSCSGILVWHASPCRHNHFHLYFSM